MSVKQFATVAAIAAVTGLSASDASAEVRSFNRVTTSNVVFSQSDFSDALVQYRNQLDSQADAAGDSRAARWNILNRFESLSVFSDSNLTLDFPAPAFDSDAGLFISETLATFNDPDSLFGSYYLGYDVPVVDGASGGLDSFISRSQVERDGNLYWALHFSGGGSNFVDAGGRFYSEFSIPGAWDPAGSGSGSVEWSFNSGFYSINDFFSYDGITTRFSVVTDNYTLLDPAGGLGSPGQNPGIRLTLIGALVPAPSSIALLALGGAITARRRR
jgi:hypothetical protein